MVVKSKWSLFINNSWSPGSGSTFISKNPATQEVIWEGKSASEQDVNRAITSAKNAFAIWAHISVGTRIQYLESFREKLIAAKKELAILISQEVGKPLWESQSELTAMISKIGISIKAFSDRCAGISTELGATRSVIRYKPHGAIAVFGPFNFPGHLPNGHIIPALLAGNTVVFKPSEQTPAVGEYLLQLWSQVDLPKGVINLVQGAKETGKALISNPEIDGVFFTGSFQTGRAIHKTLGGQPEKIVALEMGGNNPLIVTEIKDFKAAAFATIQSAYITSGQRCVCARRLILPENQESNKFLQVLEEMVKTVHVGSYSDSPEPFMGPVISETSADQLLESQLGLIHKGAKAMVPMKSVSKNRAMLSPGLLDVTPVKDRPDTEIFGPLLQLIWVVDFEKAISEANQTKYGLSAGILTDNVNLYREFLAHSRAGIVNWNRQITGASSSAPFGGIGQSGNHRPSAYFATDYCSFPVASIEAEKLAIPEALPPGITVK